MCTFFSADVGKIIDLVPVDDSPFTQLQTAIKLSFVANVSGSFYIHCFAC